MEIIEFTPLGDTLKEQWLTTVRIFDTAIRSNITRSKEYMNENNQYDDGLECELEEELETALRVLDDYTTEMNRLVEHIFKED